MGVYQTQTNFTAGELSPLLDLRFDFNKYANGAKYIENFVPLPQGGVRRRPGLRYVAEVKDSTKATRLIPFEFSTEQAYVLEFGHEYIRFFMDAGQIRVSDTSDAAVELSTPYQEADLFDLKFAQSADVLYIVHPNYPPHKLLRLSHTNWRLERVEFIDGPYLIENKDTSKTLLPGFGDPQSDTLITVIADNGSGAIRVTSVAHGLTTGQHVWIERALTTTNANGVWTVTVIDVDNIDLQGSTFVAGSGQGGYVTKLANITASGHAPFNELHVGSMWRVHNSAPNTWGYFEVKEFISSTSVYARIRKQMVNTNTSEWREGAWSDYRGYPGAVSFFENRLMFAGSSFKPQTIWGSAIEDYEDMTPGVEDEDGVAFTLGSNQVNKILWLSAGDQLMIGTTGGEFVMFGGNDSAITPTNVTVRRKSPHGSTSAAPINVSNAALFIQRAGRKIREFAQNENGQYQAPDITIFAEHITAPAMVQMDYQQEPDSLIWIVREDGVMLTATYIPSQEVVAFALQITDGLFESVAVIPHPDGHSDQVWTIVQRNINGTVKRYVEYFDPSLYLDCAASYQGAPALTINGLQFLEGETVTLNCNCAAAFPTVTVQSGVVELPFAADPIMVGLPYIPLLHLNKPEVKLQNGTSQGRLKRWVDINVRVFETLGLEINGELFYHRDPDMPMDEGVPLFTGDIRVSNSGWDKEGELIIRQPQPFSSTILGVFGLIDVDTSSD